MSFGRFEGWMMGFRAFRAADQVGSTAIVCCKACSAASRSYIFADQSMEGMRGKENYVGTTKVKKGGEP